MLDLLSPWVSQSLAVFDFETTSLDTATCGVVSVACVRFEGWKIVDKFYSLVDPGCEISEESTKFHGLTAADVKGKPTLDTLAGSLLRVSAGAMPCGYNAQSYDRAILHRHISGTDCPLFDPAFGEWLDVLTVVRSVDAFVGGAGRHKLENTCKRWRVEIGGAHNALEDCLATARLLYRISRSNENDALKIFGSVDSPRTLAEVQTKLLELRQEQQKKFDAWQKKQPKRESA